MLVIPEVEDIMLRLKPDVAVGPCALVGCKGTIHKISGWPNRHICSQPGCQCQFALASLETIEEAAAQLGFSLKDQGFITA